MPIFLLLVSTGLSFDGAFSLWVSLKNQILWERNFANHWDEKNSRKQNFVNHDLEIFSILLQNLRKFAKSQNLILANCVCFLHLIWYFMFFFTFSKNEPSFWYTMCLIFLLVQLYLISFKLYYLYISCYQFLSKLSWEKLSPVRTFTKFAK